MAHIVFAEVFPIIFILPVMIAFYLHGGLSGFFVYIVSFTYKIKLFIRSLSHL